ncbi:MAG: hypothetical protein B6D45_05805 [Ignavibacteriales bacterium UTCHB3]|nr:MAG: hypothetical protein B6D45_05805 [Ignavibacteriales bacterium UTCHB3]
MFFYDLILWGKIARAKGKPEEKGLINVWIISLNLIGHIGSVGVLFTGIVLSMLNTSYGFFRFASGLNHWLYTKQFIMVVILILIIFVMTPVVKRIKRLLLPALLSEEPLPEESYILVDKLKRVDISVNLLVMLNILLAFSRYLI